LTDLLNILSAPAPGSVWGLVSRGIALVYLLSFVSLAPQVLPIAGRRGITPIDGALRATEAHFPTWRRFFYFPTLLWLNAGDAFLGALPLAGAAAAAAAVYGGAHAPFCLFACYVLYVSLDRAMYLVYPWDSVLFEAGFWGVFLPATLPLPELAAVSGPAPAVAWVYRLLVFRVMLGFGKHKFLGSTKKDRLFLKGFFLNQPLPTALGLLAHRLPAFAHHLALATMFVVEIILPFTVFFPGVPSAIGGAAMIALMLGIWATGNYGYFNIAVLVLSLSWFDGTTASAFRLAPIDPSEPSWWVDFLAANHFGLSLFAFPFNTFCSHTWMNWPWWSRFGPFAGTVFLARALHPFRLFHAYGVFPPRSPPQMKLAPVLEGTWDGEEWKEFEFSIYPTRETSRPRFVAPYHPRVDQAIVYEPLGLNDSSIIRNIAGRWEPYGHGGVPAGQLVIRRLLEDTLESDLFVVRPPGVSGPPRALRVRTYMLEAPPPGGPPEQHWRRTLVGPHYPKLERGDPSLERPLPPPELWNIDDLVWLRRSHLGPLMLRAAKGEDPHAFVGGLGLELEAPDLEAFWGELVPRFAAERADWTGMKARVRKLRAAFDASTLYRFERLAARYAIFLYARLEPSFLDGGLGALFGKRASTLDLPSTHHLRLFALHLVGEGRAVYDAVMKDPAVSKEHLASFSLDSGHFFHALFRYEALVYQCQKMRLLKAYIEHRGRAEFTPEARASRRGIEALARRFFGVADTMEFLRTRLDSEDDRLDVEERWPEFEILDSGEVRRFL
jgi:hypothetical protein